MEATDQNESRLIEKAVAGDTESFGRLYSLHLNSIYRYIYYRTGIIQDAEDLTEQVFLRAWEALPTYKDIGNPFSSWLYRIAHNIVVDFHRRKRMQSQSLQALYSEPNSSEEANVLYTVIKNDQYRSLASAISKLNEEQQQVIVLRFIEGMSHAEISAIIGKNEGACRMVQHRALVTLTSLLKGE